MRILIFILVSMFTLTKSFAQKEKDEVGHIYTIVEKMPEFIEGDVALFRFLRENIQLDTLEDSCQIYLGVYGFIVESTGNLTNFQINKSSGCPQFDAECLRVFSLLSKGKWRSGRHKHKKVRVAFSIPIRIRLE